ncbi:MULTISPECIES: hypothetical protein [unclassified Duganella]|uniref:hypothetical protein n=1 Tax=unclassified Duganella TaxID=2636909 RepID=UPI001E52D5D5|nr:MULTISPECIES: hypothetical protein [unclassified Duganella]
MSERNTNFLLMTILSNHSFLTVKIMTAPDKNVEDRAHFDRAMKALESQVANVGAHVCIDSTARRAYAREINAMAQKLESEALAGKLTWTEAAKQAQETRNIIMEIFRRRSTPVGRAMAEYVKIRGHSLNELVARHSARHYGENAVFKNLTPSQKNVVYASIVKSAGTSHQPITTMLSRLSHAGRGLVIISLGISAYNIATSTDKVSAAGKEVLSTGAGIGGGIAGGALAGLACGPGAPLCVTIGAFVGGTLAAFGIHSLL